jgi:hypothetical protein
VGLLSAQRSFVFADDLAVVPVDAKRVFTTNTGMIAKLGDGDDCFLIGGHVELDSASGWLLADVLPPLIHVRAASPQATVLQWLLDQLVRERATELPGANEASAQLAHLSVEEENSTLILEKARSSRLGSTAPRATREFPGSFDIEANALVDLALCSRPLAAVFQTAQYKFPWNVTLILLELRDLGLSSRRGFRRLSAARVQLVNLRKYAKLLKANVGEVAERLKAAVC